MTEREPPEGWNGPLHLYGDSEGESNRIGDELDGQNDRGAGVLGASLLDAQLAKNIALRFCKCGSTAKELLGLSDGPNAKEPQLGFMLKAKLAYCLGLIGSVSLHDISTIAKIRNVFAHQLWIDSFREPSLKELCFPPHLVTPDKVMEHPGAQHLFRDQEQINALVNVPRHRYRFTVHWISSMLIASVHKRPIEWPEIDHTKEFFW
jgi:hypothetical protein